VDCISVLWRPWGNCPSLFHLNQTLDIDNGLFIVALNTNRTANFIFCCCHMLMNTRNLNNFCLRISPHHECENDVGSNSVEIVFSTTSLEFVQIGKTSCLTAMLLSELQISIFPLSLFYNIVARRPVVKQRPRNKQLYNDRY
jgi:hypothetical protein